MSPTSRRAAVPVALLVVVALGACTDDGGDDVPEFSGSSSSSAADPSTSPEVSPSPGAEPSADSGVGVDPGDEALDDPSAAALAAFEAYMLDYSALLADPSNPALRTSEAASPTGVERLVAAADGLVARDRRVEGPISLEPEVSVSETVAGVQGCLDQSGTTLLDGSGAPVDTDEATRLSFTALLSRSGDGAWLVDSVEFDPAAPC